MGALVNSVVPAAVTLAVHALIVAVLFVGWEATPTPQRIVPPNFVEAKLVQLDEKSKKKASAKKQPKKIDLTAKRKEQERLKREADKKRKASEAKQKEAEAKKIAEQKKKAAEDQRKKEEARKARELDQRLQQEFERALAEEEGMLLDEEYAVEAQSYTAKFRQRVENNWTRPPSARTGMRCLLAIQLVPTGRIVSVSIKESSGNTAFDRSAVQAVKKVETFPEVKEMTLEVFERYYRKFNFLFDPQDLRL